ncbi:MAG: stage III sporulation protein AB [Anaerostipes sp.]|jgi:stage III sporulation protein AB|nr:stage III sporulation protein AB [Anaerostipes sp.]MDD3747015.1 stage III sporulation protein AB [Anaerostipes sp.]
MLKLIGCILVILTGCLLGFYKSLQEKRKLQQGYDLKRFLYLLEGEIRYGLTPLPDAFEHIAAKTSKELKPFLMGLSKALKEYQSERFFYIWRKKIKEDLQPLIIEKKFLGPIISLGESIGYLDQQMQLKTIMFSMEQLEDIMYDLKDQVRKNCKMYQILGAASGILIVIFVL